MSFTSDPGPPKVTVAITTHNRQELADRAMASALDQQDVDLRIVVVDDGSNPPYRLKIESDSVQLIRTDPARGPSHARNLAIEKATGEWITFLDDDDVLAPNMLALSIAAAEASPLPPPVSTLSGAEIITPEGEVLRTRIPPSLDRGMHFFLEDLEEGGSFQTHATLVAPLSVVRDIGGWDEDLLASEHDDFFLRLNAASSIQGIDEVTYQITAHDGPRLSKAVLARAEGMQKTVIKHKEAFRKHPKRFSRYLSTMGLTYLRAGSWGPAIAATARSVAADPTSTDAYKRLAMALAGPWALNQVRGLRHDS